MRSALVCGCGIQASWRSHRHAILRSNSRSRAMAGADRTLHVFAGDSRSNGCRVAHSPLRVVTLLGRWRVPANGPVKEAPEETHKRFNALLNLQNKKFIPDDEYAQKRAEIVTERPFAAAKERAASM